MVKLIKEFYNCYFNEVIGDSLIGNFKKFWFYVKYSKFENFGIFLFKMEDGMSIIDKNKVEIFNFYFFLVFI